MGIRMAACVAACAAMTAGGTANADIIQFDFSGRADVQRGVGLFVQTTFSTSFVVDTTTGMLTENNGSYELTNGLIGAPKMGFGGGPIGNAFGPGSRSTVDWTQAADGTLTPTLVDIGTGSFRIVFFANQSPQSYFQLGQCFSTTGNSCGFLSPTSYSAEVLSLSPVPLPLVGSGAHSLGLALIGLYALASRRRRINANAGRSEP